MAQGAKFRGKPRYTTRRKPCSFCINKESVISYKEPARLRSFISDRGKIEPRRRSGACAKHQRALARAIKQARHLALLPFTMVQMRKTGGVGLRS